MSILCPLLWDTFFSTDKILLLPGMLSFDATAASDGIIDQKKLFYKYLFYLFIILFYFLRWLEALNSLTSRDVMVLVLN